MRDVYSGFVPGCRNYRAVQGCRRHGGADESKADAEQRQEAPAGEDSANNWRNKGKAEVN